MTNLGDYLEGLERLGTPCDYECCNSCAEARNAVPVLVKFARESLDYFGSKGIPMSDFSLAESFQHILDESEASNES